MIKLIGVSACLVAITISHFAATYKEGPRAMFGGRFWFILLLVIGDIVLLCTVPR